MNTKKYLKKAYDSFNQNRFQEALDALNKVLDKYPNHPDALNNKGLILIKLGKKEQSIQLFKKSVEVRFDLKIYFNLIALLIDTKKLNEARSYNEKIKPHTNNIQITINEAIILKEEQRYEEALKIYEDLIKKYPNEINFYVSKGFILNQIKKYDEAIESYINAIELDNNYYPAIYNLGITYNNNQQYVEAIHYLKKSLEINKSNADGWLTLAAAQVKEDLINDARESIDKAASIDNYHHIDVLIEAKYQSALVELNDDNNFSEAERLFGEILKIRPDHIEANFHMGLTYLKQKKYKDVSHFYRYRTKRAEKYGRYDDFDLPKIDKNTELLIGGEQGIGDQIILIRLIPFLKNKVKDIKYGSYEKIKKFFKLNFQENFDVIGENELKERENGDLTNYKKINLFSIFHYIDDIDQEIKNIKLLKCDENLKKYYRNKYREKNKPLIGISWTSKVQKIGKLKSYQLSDIYQILNRTDEFSFINLQYGDVKDEIADFNKNKGTKIQFDYELDYYNDIYSLASLVAACDVIITCSNVTAHIAGSLGIKTFVMLPKKNAKLWYWYENENISSWYPSVNLINQTTYRDWNNPVKQIIKELENL